MKAMLVCYNAVMTRKQRKFFIELLQSNSYAEAARKAGYSEKSCRVSAHKNITKYNGLFAEVMDKAGITSDHLAKALKKGLNSKDERVKFQYFKLAFQTIGNVLEKDDQKLEESYSSINLAEEAQKRLKKYL